MRFIGIDFSGDAGKWRRIEKNPSVWIAELSSSPVPVVQALYPVQQLAGSGSPFENLAAFLRQGDYFSAGIDAPFSIPAPFMPDGGWPALLDLNNQLPHPNRPFPRGDGFLAALTSRPPAKHYRHTENRWRQQGLNVRSPLWWTPRGGAPLTTACLKLLALSKPKACWPWSTSATGMLTEAFPMAQLRQWKLPYQVYNGDKGQTTRGQMIDALETRVSFGSYLSVVRASADALDAVLAGFAAIAVSRGVAPPPAAHWPDTEGCIAVHP